MISLADIDAIESALDEVSDCKLIIIDPIGSFLGSRVDAHRVNEVRSVLAPLAQLAQTYGMAVVIVAHQRKNAGTFADDTVLGSRAFTGLGRAVWHVAEDPECPARRRLAGKLRKGPCAELPLADGGKVAGEFRTNRPEPLR